MSAKYDALRFGGAGGARVNQRELELVLRLLGDLPAGARLLDLACGTGRLARVLYRSCYRVAALDFSVPMLQQAQAALAAPARGSEASAVTAATGAVRRDERDRAAPDETAPRQQLPTFWSREGASIHLIQGDAFALPFPATLFDGVVALRFAFHWRELGPLLAEMRCVAAPGAPLVFDTYVWTPRALLALDAARWGGKVFTHRPRAVRALAAELGLAVEAEVPCFLCSPYVYRRLPLPAVRALERVERVVPPRWLCRVFWRLRRG